MDKKRLVLGIAGLVILCVMLFYYLIWLSSNKTIPEDPSLPKPPNEKYLNDVTYCEKDSDCTGHLTHCTCCGCAEPVNIYNAIDLDCPPCEIVCHVECPHYAKCVDNECKLFFKFEMIEKCVDKWNDENLIPGRDYSTGELLIKFKNNVSKENAIYKVESEGLVVKDIFDFSTRDNYSIIILAAVKKSTEFKWICDYNLKNVAVEYAKPNYLQQRFEKTD